jgi:putative hydrolase of the HAD superfamily
MIQYVFFDVAGTILGKPKLYSSIQDVLTEQGFKVSLEEIKVKHKLLSEIIQFPDRTNQEFYNKFNSDLLYLLGVIPTSQILNSIFSKCTYLPWETFDDSIALHQIDLPLGIISNFNSTLRIELAEHFGNLFKDIIVSEEIGVAKPNMQIYQHAFSKVSFRTDEILYVGDSIKLDLQIPQQLGCKVLIIDRDNIYPNLENRISSLIEITKFLD